MSTSSPCEDVLLACLFWDRIYLPALQAQQAVVGYRWLGSIGLVKSNQTSKTWYAPAHAIKQCRYTRTVVLLGERMPSLPDFFFFLRKSLPDYCSAFSNYGWYIRRSMHTTP